MTSVTEYSQATDLEHMRNQTAMYLGNKKIVGFREYVYNETDKTVKYIDVNASPAALKCFDEILVNAIDQYTKHRSNIAVVVDEKTGIVTIENDKSCVSIKLTETRDGRKMYTTQMIFGEFKTGSNLSTDDDSITGGVFGIGAKGVNAFSKTFRVETYDPNTKTLYNQLWRDCLQTVEPPLVEIVENTKPFVRVTFLLNFSDFQMDPKRHFADFFALCRMRVIHTAAFCEGIRVTWNGTLVEYGSLEQLAGIYVKPYGDPQLVTFDMYNKKRLRWSVVVAIKRNSENLEQVSIVNGVYVKSGTHLDYIVDQILNYVKPLWLELRDPAHAKVKTKTAKQSAKTTAKQTAKPTQSEPKAPRFDRRYVLKYLFMFMSGYINRPGFTGQRKDIIDTSQTEYQEYHVPEQALVKIWDLLKPYIEFELFEKSVKKDKQKPRTKRVKAKKYTPAEFAGGPRSLEASLFICEGDSAVGTVDKGVSLLPNLGYERYGIFSIQGVPMNARREVTVKHHPVTKERVVSRSDKLMNNERYNALVAILGLDFNCKYRDGDFSSLNYGHVIIAADQDEDGKGNIRSQVLNFFWTFWPELVRHQYVQFMITPIVRALHPKLTIREFYTERAYHEWRTADPESSKYRIKYYKGLSNHEKDEIINMFSNFQDLLITYTADAKTEDVFDVFFGDNADLRKRVLRIPAKNSESHYYTEDRTISATNHLRTETRSYQIYNISRHIPHFVDGLLPGKRKVVAGARNVFRKHPSEMKVIAFAGTVMADMNYHHGDASLNNTILNMAQMYRGAREFPLLLPFGGEGSQKRGGLDIGSPRYTCVKYNRILGDALMPVDDDYILTYTFDDGHRGEPLYYVPIVPLALLEHYQSPGHGWSTVIWARDYWEISTWLRMCIERDELGDRKMDFAFTQNRIGKQTIRFVKKTEICVGSYRIRNDTLIIDELPVRMWNEHFINGNPDNKESTGVVDMEEVVDTPRDKSTDRKTHIEIDFRPGYLAELAATADESDTYDPVIRKFDLKQSLKPNLNFIGMTGSVQEFETHLEIFNAWYHVRREFYAKRVERMLILLRMRIRLALEQTRFIELRDEMDIAGKPETEQLEILRDAKFAKLDKSLIDRPSYTVVSDLEKLITTGPGADYDYLLKMNSKDLSKESRRALAESIKRNEDEIKRLSAKDVVRKTWLAELTHLDDIVKRGQTDERGWLAWEPKKNFGKK